MPLKEIALGYLDEVDDEARRIGSVNTVIVRTDGSLYGRTSDGFGFIENLKDRVPEWQPSAGPVTLFGAGGSARSIAAALTAVGETEIRIVNRTPDRAEALARDLGAGLVPYAWDDRQTAIQGAHLLVNTTTQGMVGHSPLDIVLRDLQPDAIVADIVYTPLETPLLLAARLAGYRPADGLGMLLHQARPGFEAWFGVAPEVDERLRQAVLAA